MFRFSVRGTCFGFSSGDLLMLVFRVVLLDYFGFILLFIYFFTFKQCINSLWTDLNDKTIFISKTHISTQS